MARGRDGGAGGSVGGGSSAHAAAAAVGASRAASVSSRGGGEEEWAERASRMHSELECRDRTYHLKKYRNVFLGSDAVAWLLREDDVNDVKDALDVGNELLDRGYFRHVANDHRLENKYLFYVWTFDPEHSPLSPLTPAHIDASAGGAAQGVASQSLDGWEQVSRKSAEDSSRAASVDRVSLDRIAAEMQQSLTVRDRTYHLIRYKRCFVAREAVDWLVGEGYAADRAAATMLGQQMLISRKFRHVVNPDQPFGDAWLFFRWIEDEEAAFIKDLEALTAESEFDMDSSAGDDSGPWTDAHVRECVGRLASLAREAAEERVAMEKQMAETAHKAVKAEQAIRAWRAVAAASLALAFIGPIVATALAAVAAYLFSAASLLGSDATAGDSSVTDELSAAADAAAAAVGASTTSAEEESSHETESTALDPRVSRLRTALREEFPEISQDYTDEYLNAVLSAPSKKDPNKPRSFQYAKDKLLQALRWRATLKIPSLSSATPGVGVASLYWCGYDRERRPILWVHPTRKDWKNLDLEGEAELHVAMIEFGLKLMPPGVSTFTVVANAKGLGFSHINASFAKMLLKLITTGYPDRLGSLYAGPVNVALRSIFSLLSPLMPRNLAAKIHLMGSPTKELEPVCGSDRVPDFFDGPLDHALETSDVSGRFSVDTMKASMESAVHPSRASASS